MPTGAELVAQINSAFGEGTMLLGSDVAPMTHWPTNVLPVDAVLDGGLPVGRFTEIYGDYSTLKSYVAYKALGSVQSRGGSVALIDTEHAFDKDWAGSLGVDTKNLLVQRPPTGEDAIGVMEALVRGGFDLIVWDSIAASQPKQYAEKKPGEDLQPGGQARMMSAGLRRINSANKTSAILAINQTRVNVGMTYGSTRDSMPGGKAMPFYASYRLRFGKAGQVSEDGNIWTGEKLETAKIKVKQKIKVTMEKWKLNAPVREVWLDFDLRQGAVDEVGWMIGWAIEQGYVQMAGGGSYTMGDISIRGRDKFFQAVAEDEEMIQWMKQEITQDWVLASPGSPGEVPKKKAARTKS